MHFLPISLLILCLPAISFRRRHLSFVLEYWISYTYGSWLKEDFKAYNPSKGPRSFKPILSNARTPEMLQDVSTTYVSSRKCRVCGGRVYLGSADAVLLALCSILPVTNSTWHPAMSLVKSSDTVRAKEQRTSKSCLTSLQMSTPSVRYVHFRWSVMR